MLVQRLALARPLARRALPLIAPTSVRGIIAKFPEIPDHSEPYPAFDDKTDPGMNGGYVNPPPEKRQFRDPYGDWWDKQGRRNYGEPVHEDDDILGRFSPEEYTFVKPKKAFAMNGVFIMTVLSFAGVCYMYYPDKPAVPRTFPHDGLVTSLGGPKALPAASDRED
ncbi:hypothetical protein RUND412_000866 [Rhizina undulata]